VYNEYTPKQEVKNIGRCNCLGRSPVLHRLFHGFLRTLFYMQAARMACAFAAIASGGSDLCRDQCLLHSRIIRRSFSSHTFARMADIGCDSCSPEKTENPHDALRVFPVSISGSLCRRNHDCYICMAEPAFCRTWIHGIGWSGTASPVFPDSIGDLCISWCHLSDYITRGDQKTGEAQRNCIRTVERA